MAADVLRTPDGRYLVVRGRLWRCTDPRLDAEQRAASTKRLMAARRAKQTAMRAADPAARDVARQAVDDAKQELGERGPVWWTDGAPDLTRRMARTTVYADWYATIDDPVAAALRISERPSPRAGLDCRRGSVPAKARAKS